METYMYVGTTDGGVTHERFEMNVTLETMFGSPEKLKVATHRIYRRLNQIIINAFQKSSLNAMEIQTSQVVVSVYNKNSFK